MRQNDDNWRKEKSKLTVEIEALKTVIQEADQKFRSLELQKLRTEHEQQLASVKREAEALN